MLESHSRSAEFENSSHKEEAEAPKKKPYKLVGNLSGQSLEIYTHARDLDEAVHNAGHQLEEKYREPEYSRIPYLKKRFMEKVIVYCQEDTDSDWTKIEPRKVNEVLTWRK